MLTSNPALPPKALGTNNLHRDASTKDIPLRTEQVTVSPKFIGTEKVKQNEKTEELVSKEKEKKTPAKNETEINNQIKNSQH